MNSNLTGRWAKPDQWPTDFGGKVFLFRAVGRIGRFLFAEQWTGKECLVVLRPQLSGLLPNSDTSESQKAMFDLKQKQPDLLPDVTYPLHAGIYSSHWKKWTPHAWRAAKLMYEKENEALWPSVKRFSQAKLKVVEYLQTGKLETFLRPREGGKFSGPYSEDIWNTERWEGRFIEGMLNPDEPFSAAFAGNDFEYLFVDDEGLSAIEAKQIQTGESTQSPVKKGAPPKVSPTAFEAEAFRIMDENGFPDPKLDPNWRQATLEKHMMGWHRDELSATRNRQLTKKAMKAFKIARSG